MSRWFEAGVFLALVALLIAIGYVSEPRITGYAVEQDAYVHPVVEAMLAENGSARVIVEYRDHIGARDLRALAQRYRGAGAIDRAAFERLRTDRSIAGLYPDIRVSTLLDESIPLINASKAWNRSSVGAGEGRSVCVIDTGIDYTHPDLGGCDSIEGCTNVLGGYDFVNDDSDPMDDEGHGTHVAGIAVGVAPNASLVAIKALDSEGGGWLSDVMDGVSWCVDHADEYNISVISMSLGGPNIFTSTCDSFHPPWTTIIDSAVDAGMLVVSATGNTGSTSGVNFPACVGSSIRVGASESGSIASYTNRGPAFSDIVLAPGTGIESSALGGGYATKSGTSMATPHVSGSLVLLTAYAHAQNMTLDRSSALQALATGPMIDDNASGLSLPRIDVMAALVELDSTTPLIDVSWNASGNLTVSWNATDDLRIEAVNATLTGPNATSVVSNGSTGSITVSNAMYGTYRFDAHARDAAGNTASSNASYVLKQAPNLSLTVNGSSEDVTFVGTRNLTINATVLSGSSLSLFVNGTLLGSNASLSVPYVFVAPGSYPVVVVHEETDAYDAANASLIITALDGTPIISGRQPNASVSFNETGSTAFLVDASNPLSGSLTYAWSLDGSPVSNASNVTLNATIGYGTHELALVVSNEEGSTNATWNVTLLPVAPSIAVSPAPGSIELDANATKAFFVNASDPLDRAITYAWSLDGSPVSNASNATVGTAGTLVLVVSNSAANATASWTITALEPLAFTEPIADLHWREDERAPTLDLSEHFTGAVSYALEADRFSMSVQGSSARFSADGIGSESVRIIASRGTESVASNAFTISMSEAVGSSGGSGGGSSGSSGSSGGGGIVTQRAEPEPLREEVSVEPVLSSIERIDVSLVEPSRSASVRAREVASLPDGMPRLERVYRTLELSVENGTAANATIRFSVERAWIASERVDPADVALYRFEDPWVELETEHLGSRDGMERYVALTPGFSYFAVAARPAPEPAPVEIDTPAPVQPMETDEQPSPERDANPLIVLLFGFGIVAIATLTERMRARIRH